MDKSKHYHEFVSYKILQIQIFHIFQKKSQIN